MLSIAARPEAIDPDWLTAVLREAGVLPHGAVTQLRYEPIGNGLIGDSVKLTPRYDRAGDGAPPSLVAKFAAADPTSKAAGAQMRLYAKELSFYREIAGTVDIRTPQIYYAQLDPVTSDFTLLMEDMSPARFGDQISGCGIADCELAAREAARLHGPRWGDPALDAIAWLAPAADEAGNIAALLPPIAAAFKARYASSLDDRLRDTIDRFVAVYPGVLADRSAPQTIQHGDFRLDNVMFDVQGIGGTMVTLDWQTVTVGPGVVDIAFFIGGALSRDERRQHEQRLVRGYYANLRRYRSDYSWDACWRDYRRFAFLGMFCAVFSPMVVQRTERSDALFQQMLRRHVDQVLDLDSFACW